MAVIVGRMVAVLEAQTTQFEARMSAAGQQMTRWNNVTANAHRGTNLLRSGLQSLALDGLGSLPGPIGRVLAGFSSLAVGGPVVIGVLTMANLITTAWKNVSDRAIETAKHISDLRTQFIRLQDSQIGSLQLQIAATNTPPGGKTNAELEQRAQLLTKLLTSGLAVGGAPQTGLFRELTAIQTELVLRRAITDELDKQIHKVQELRGIEAAKEAPFFLLRPRGRTVDFGAFGPEVPTPHFIKDPFANVSTMFGRGQTPAPVKPAGFQLTPEFAIMSGMALLQGAQGGPAALFGAAAGPLAMINPLAGAITAGVGTLFSLFDNSEERRHKQLVDAIKQMGEEVGLDRVTVIFTGPDGHQIRKTLAELEAGDAVERVPGPVGAQG